VRALVREAAGYAVASGCALLVDMSILFGLAHFEHWNYEIAAAVSFMAGSVVAYRISTQIAFRHRRLRDRRVEFASFVAIGTAGLAVNAAVMYAAVAGFGLSVMAAKCVAAGFTFACNFVCRRQLLFVAGRVA
jgi:putative flippase GtrA